MKNVKHALGKLLSAFLVVSLLSASMEIIFVSADTGDIFHQDFDHTATGSYPVTSPAPTWINNEFGQPDGGTNATWSYSSSSSGTIQVAADPDNPNNKYVKLINPAGDSSSFYAGFASVAPKASSILVFEARIKTLPATDTGTVIFLLNPSVASSYNAWYLSISKNGIKNGNNNSDLITGLSPDTWYYIRLTTDLSSTYSNSVTLTCGTVYNNPTKVARFALYGSYDGGAVKISPRGSTSPRALCVDNMRAYVISTSKSNLLADLQVDGGTMNVFDPGNTNFAASSMNNTVKLKPVLYDTSATVTINGQTVSNNTWSGDINLNPTATTNVTVVVTPSQYPTLPAKTYNISLTKTDGFVIDNGDYGYSEAAGTWYDTTTLAGYNGLGTRYNSNDSASATWNPNKDYNNNDNYRVKGNMNIYYWKSTWSDGVRDAKVSIVHNGKTDTVHLNLDSSSELGGNTSGFRYLGTFDFAGTGMEYVKVEKGTSEAGAGRSLRVDSVKFETAKMGAISQAYKKVDGETVTDITSTGLTSGSVKSQLNLLNNTGSVQNVNVVIALYNKSTKAMEDVKITNETFGINESRTVDSGLVSVPAGYQNYMVKTFVWTDDTMQPLIKLDRFLAQQ